MKLRFLMVIFILIGTIMTVNCKKTSNAEEPVPGPVTVVFDAENVKTVTIGNQTWMAENLKVTVDPGGNRLNSISVNNDSGNDELYGRLYNFNEAVAACPPGWHLPSIEEWNELFITLGGIEIAGGKIKTVGYWDQPNAGATNSSGFSAVPSGGEHDGFGWACHFWSSTEDGDNAYIPSLMNSRENAYILYDQSKTLRLSVRYIKD